MKLSAPRIGTYLLSFCLLTAFHPAQAAPQTPAQAPPLKSTLGPPFGSLQEVKGIILEPLKSKATDPRLRIKVTHLNQKPLKSPVTLPLSFFSFASVEAPKPGSEVTYIGYETGSFKGIPEAAFEWIPRVASSDFHFASTFQVVKAHHR